MLRDSISLTKCSSPSLISDRGADCLVALAEDGFHKIEPYASSWPGYRGTLRLKSLSWGWQWTRYNVLCPQLYSLSDLIKVAEKEYSLLFLVILYPENGLLTYHGASLDLRRKVCQVILFFLPRRCIWRTRDIPTNFLVNQWRKSPKRRPRPSWSCSRAINDASLLFHFLCRRKKKMIFRESSFFEKPN